MPSLHNMRPPTDKELAGLANKLERAIERHPAFDILAEYEAAVIDRHPLAYEHGTDEPAYRVALRQRIESIILDLET